jgi:fatty-acyl-CoA synthase
MDIHLATLLEASADHYGGDTALIHGRLERSYRDLENRAARLGSAFSEAGLNVHSKVAIYSLNRPEWLEAMYAAFKVGGVPVNVNYRYGENELHYLLDNADAEAVVFEARYAPMLRSIVPQLPKLKLLVELADEGSEHLDGATAYEPLIAAHSPLARFKHGPDEIYMYYTGGTTGMPKGVMWRHTDFAQRQLSAHPTRYGDLGLVLPTNVEEYLSNVAVIRANARCPTRVVACPFMHGAGLWVGGLQPLTAGGAAVTLTSINFDPHELWRVVVETKADSIAIVGDAFARPMLHALEVTESPGRPYDISKLKRVISTGVMWSAEVKSALLARHDMELIDAMGSTEGGGYGSSTSTRANQTPTARFTITPTTKVFTDDGHEVQPGSGVVGAIASGGVVPIGYYKDPEKSAKTFRTVGGVRYTFTGDYARVEDDGTITLLGRGSQCINTGGEKVYPEEVEEALKRHPAVSDCLVVGVVDTRFGEKLVAVVSVDEKHDVSDEELMQSVRQQLAAYKAPRLIVRVPIVRRAPNGKADYAWAKETARQATGV